MAAAPASQPETRACIRCGAVPDPSGVCASCGTPQPIATGEDYFSVFGLSTSFSHDLQELERRFYELSRKLHPDRFGGADAQVRSASVERMSFVNDAYRTLKDPSTLRDYVLELEGIKAVGKASIPSELAESWFEIQDALAENREAALHRLKGFEGELAAVRDKTNAEIAELESKFDAGAGRVALETLSKKVQELSYLESLKRDVERIRGKF